MQEVLIQLENIQSHENTSFTLKPGMNFILSSGNNVGKSTIFKVLSTVAKAPNNPSSKIASLVRYGATRGLAQFSFGADRVLAIFINNHGEAAKLFFEHTHIDGSVTRSVECPRSLITALGIQTLDGVVVNFNDADSVQLISTVSSDTDAIINHVMLDERVESIKSNLYELGRNINSDYKIISAKKTTTQDFLKDLSYSEIVEEFIDNKAVIEAACRVADYNLIPIACSKWSQEDCDYLSMLHRLCDLLQALSGVADAKFQTESETFSRIIAGCTFAAAIRNLSEDSWTKGVAVERIQELRDLCKMALSFSAAYKAASSIETSLKKLADIEKETLNIRSYLDSNLQIVRCPVKGKVYYGETECIPYSY